MTFTSFKWLFIGIATGILLWIIAGGQGLIALLIAIFLAGVVFYKQDYRGVERGTVQDRRKKAGPVGW